METCKNSPPFANGGGTKKKRVCYYYDPHISYFDYGEGHVMVPHRVTMTHSLVAAYGLLDDMDLLRVAPASREDLEVAHSKEYLDLLRDVTPARYNRDAGGIRRLAEAHKVGPVRDKRTGCVTNENPVIDDLWDYCRRYAGGSLAAARALAAGEHAVAINWSGGMHHAGVGGGASGFCYVNDIVVAVAALLRRFGRVLYVDVDAHHGDGVERAFLAERRVMTVSFHQYDGKEFFPYTGAVDDVGAGGGAAYRTLNVPLEAGTSDARYHRLFGPIMERVMEVFRPDAVVMQCGADSLAGDRIAGLGLSVRGHAKCVRLLLGYNLPLPLLGGGGYTINHVASCWCYETAVAIGKEIPDEIPQHWHQHYYKSQGYKLHYSTAGGGNGRGETKHMVDVKRKVMAHLEQLAALMASPSKQPSKEPVCAEEDVDEMLDNSPRGEDAVEGLHRRCAERDLREFLEDLGRKTFLKQRN